MSDEELMRGTLEERCQVVANMRYRVADAAQGLECAAARLNHAGDAHRKAESEMVEAKRLLALALEAVRRG